MTSDMTLCYTDREIIFNPFCFGYECGIPSSCNSDRPSEEKVGVSQGQCGMCYL